MPLTSTQLTTLKADIIANSDLNTKPNNPDGAFAIAALYNLPASPDYWVWRTSVFESEFTRATTPAPDNTAWSWTAYIGRSQGERDAWTRMFMGGGSGMNPSLVNVRQGLADVFSGAGGAAQRAHLLVVARRRASRVEKLFAVAGVGPGNDGGAARGSTTNPDVMGFEGQVSYQDVEAARALP